jgi:hypothetical protein
VPLLHKIYSLCRLEGGHALQDAYIVSKINSFAPFDSKNRLFLSKFCTETP